MITTNNSVESLKKKEKFKRITEWVLREGKIKPENLDWAEHSGWLYAFVVGDETVRYIGLTDHVLRSRLDHYSYGLQSTNKRVRQSITFELKRGQNVVIYGRKEPNKVRLHAEEKRLIGDVRPDWNNL